MPITSCVLISDTSVYVLLSLASRSAVSSFRRKVVSARNNTRFLQIILIFILSINILVYIANIIFLLIG